MKALTLSIILACFVMAFSAMGNAANLEDSLVFYFPLDEGSGNEVKDLSKNGFTGTFIGKPEWIKEGKDGSALHLDGASWVKIPKAEQLNKINKYMTLSVWVRTKTPAEQVFVHRGPWDIGCIDLYVMDNLASFEIRIPAAPWALVQGPNIIDGKWHNVAGTYDTDADELRIYVDGKMEGKKEETRDGGEVEMDWALGAWTDGEHILTGDIDEAALFDIALTEEEIKQVMEGTFKERILAVDTSSKLTTTWAKIKARSW